MIKMKMNIVKLSLALAVVFAPLNYAPTAAASSTAYVSANERAWSDSLSIVGTCTLAVATAYCVVKGAQALFDYVVPSAPKEIPESDAQEAREVFQAHEQSIEYPDSIDALQNLVKKAAQEGKKIAIMGAGKSQGGQTQSLNDASYRVCLSKINKLLNLDVKNKKVVIQAGATWQELIEYINPHRLAVKAMQSYSSFSIGGSLGVNVHGQDLIENPLIRTVEAFTLLKADGTIVKVDRTNENKELFGLVIGGYGLLGIVVDVTLQLTDDELLERKAEYLETHDARDHFLLNVQTNPDCKFMSARLSVNPQDLFDKTLFIKYEKSQKNDKKFYTLTSNAGLPWRQYFIKKLARSSIRFALEAWFNKQPLTISRNNFMNSSIYVDLPQDTDNERYILQEYFIPSFPYEDGTHLYAFHQYVKEVTQKFGIEVLNLTARFIREDHESVLSFARHEACALVFYIKAPRNTESDNAIIQWTRCLIDKALELNGTFYLPYHLIATQEQFEKSYPRWHEFVGRKRQYDPCELFTNQLYEKYAKSIPTQSPLAGASVDSQKNRRSAAPLKKVARAISERRGIASKR